MLTLSRQREERDPDTASVTSDDVSSDVMSLNDDEAYDVMVGDRKSSVVGDTLKEDLERFRKIRKEKEKFKVSFNII